MVQSRLPKPLFCGIKVRPFAQKTCTLINCNNSPTWNQDIWGYLPKFLSKFHSRNATYFIQIHGNLSPSYPMLSLLYPWYTTISLGQENRPNSWDSSFRPLLWVQELSWQPETARQRDSVQPARGSTIQTMSLPKTCGQFMMAFMQRDFLKNCLCSFENCFILMLIEFRYGWFTSLDICNPCPVEPAFESGMSVFGHEFAMGMWVRTTFRHVHVWTAICSWMINGV